MSERDALRLPIDDVADEVLAGLAAGSSLVVVAPPGAGKTTRLPMLCVEEDWCEGQKIILVEPRRLAARAAAERMASLYAERIGDKVGLRARLDTRVSRQTRIEVITEGVFTRMVLDDPSLEGVAAVFFDEFHERSLDADFGLALALDVHTGLRDDLKLLVMSATLDGARVSEALPGCRIVESKGRAFDVQTIYVGRGREKRLDDHVAETVFKAIRQHAGDVLVFLPGQREIQRTQDALDERLSEDDRVDVLPLYSGLPYAKQKLAISPERRAGWRKVILSTAVAESSLTIEGVRVVVDAGLSRVPRFDPGCGMNRLETVRVSRASADQRRGRAGRTAPGVCYRLWDEPETRALLPFDEPEILSTDLTGLVLDCAEWGVSRPEGLSWLDKPPAGLWEAAREDLILSGALDRTGLITEVGRNVRQLPMPPRLAGMVLLAACCGRDVLRLACQLAVLLVERGVGGTSVDVRTRHKQFANGRGERIDGLRQLASRWAEAASRLVGDDEKEVGDAGNALRRLHKDRRGDDLIAALLLVAFSDRIAMARDKPGQFLMANGRAAQLQETDALAQSPFLIIAELQGLAKAPRILLAAPIGRSLLEQVAVDRITHGREVRFDVDTKAIVGRDVVRLDALILKEQPAPVEPGPDVQSALARAAVSSGLSSLPWSSSNKQLLARVDFLKRAGGPVADTLPDVGDESLSASAERWLAPFLSGMSRVSEISAEVLGQAIDSLVPWQHRKTIDMLAPSHYEAPTGTRVAIDYSGENAPAVSIRVQELFGLSQHPSVCDGRLPLTLTLLSPAHRPIQITHDLPGFWAGSWSDVKADMKGRYPKHVWPDEPASAQPTARAEPRK